MKENASLIYHAIIYVPPNIFHMPKLLNMYQWGKYANICVTYEHTGINHMMRSAVHRKQWCQQWQWLCCSLIILAKLAIGQFSQILLPVWKFTNTHKHTTICDSQEVIWQSQISHQPKSILLAQPCPTKVKIIQNQSFQDNAPSQWKSVQSEQFQEYHIFQEWKLLKINPFQKPHPPKVNISQIQCFRTTTSS